jgi:hypothetical protein
VRACCTAADALAQTLPQPQEPAELVCGGLAGTEVLGAVVVDSVGLGELLADSTLFRGGAPGVPGRVPPPRVTRVTGGGAEGRADVLRLGSVLFLVISSKKARASAASLSLAGAVVAAAPFFEDDEVSLLLVGGGGAANESRSSKSWRASCCLDMVAIPRLGVSVCQ